jgi:CheY-like chemotaxis protein
MAEKGKRRIRLVHWNAAEAQEQASILRLAGYRVEAGPVDSEGLRRLREDPPDSVIIDLSRIPSHGREVGLALRTSRATRRVPLIFAGGDPAKVRAIRKLLPDAVYEEWSGIAAALPDAMSNPPADPVVPPSNLAGYSQTPLPRKLGIKEGHAISLRGAPSDFEKTLGKIPPGARLHRGGKGKRDLEIWFVRSLKELQGGIGRRIPEGGLWIAWPKKASGVETDLSETEVRRAGLQAGLVDYKVCAIDAVWSGLKFARSRK